MYSTRFSQLNPYVPGEQPQDRRYIKLNTNENPYPPTPAIAEFLGKFDIDRLRRYPDPMFTKLRAAAAHRYGLEPANVFAGNGSDEILSFAFFAFFDSVVAYADPSYSFYPVYCDYYGLRGVGVALDEQLGIDIEALAKTEPVNGMVIANPNSPTGAYIDFSRLEAVIASYPRDQVIVVDEAYIQFGGESVAPLVKRFENLLVVHTFSKWASLAGLRLGLAYGSLGLIAALFNTKDAFNSYPVHELAQRIGVIALEQSGYYDELCGKIISTRQATTRRLEELGWQVTPSRSNFLFVRHPVLSGADAYTQLKERGILVRHFDTSSLTDFLRITIGTDEEMDRLIEELTIIHRNTGTIHD